MAGKLLSGTEGYNNMSKTIFCPNISSTIMYTFFLFQRFVIYVCVKVGVSLANIRLYHYHADKKCKILKKY